MTEAELALIRKNVESLYRGTRRSWQGFGGTGNPFETWDDLKGMAGLSFAMDPDAVFTTTNWGASRVVDLAKRLQTQCDRIISATEQLVKSAEDIQDLDPLLRSYAMLNQQVLDIRRSGRANAGITRLAAIRRELSSFAQGSLAPAVTQAQLDGSSRSPVEARSYIRKELPALLGQMTQMDDAVESLSGAVSGLESTVPAKVALSWVQKIADGVGSMQVRMLVQPSSERADQAMTDLTALASDLANLELLDRSSMPTLERGQFNCVAAGSGDGAVIQGTASAPYRLVTGTADILRVKVDGGPTQTVTLPSAADTITVMFPKSASKDAPPAPTMFYNIPAVPALQELRFVVNGTVGAASASFVGGAAMTTTQVVTALTAPGVIPDDGFVPYLLIDAPDGVPVGPPGFGIHTVRIRYNPAATPTVDLGAHILIHADYGLLSEFGFSPFVDSGTTHMVHVAEWPAPTQAQVFLALRQALGAGVLAELPASLVAVGNSYIEFGFPNTVYFAHYYGSGIWDAPTRKLTLALDALRKVLIGDIAVFNGTFLGTVESIEPDGVVVDTSSGTPLASGTYGGAVTPPPASIASGMVLETTYQTRTTCHRIAGVPVSAPDGRLSVPVSRTSWLHFLSPAITLDARIILDVERLRSADNGPGGSLELVAGAGDASAALGMSIGLVQSQVDQLSTATGSFVDAGVASGDVIRPAGGPDWIVDEVISPTRLRVTSPVDGTFVGGVTIYNHRYLRYNEDLATPLAGWSAVPGQDAIQKEAFEAVRAEGMTAAGNRLKDLLLQVKAAAWATEGVATSYRQMGGEPSPYMVDLREAFEEAGADRAADYLQSGRVREMLGFAADDANSSRQLMKTMRILGRRSLGTSVYLAARELEQAVLLRPDTEIFFDGTALPVEEVGPPRRTRR